MEELFLKKQDKNKLNWGCFRKITPKQLKQLSSVGGKGLSKNALYKYRSQNF
jgi:hypothetical protein